MITSRAFRRQRILYFDSALRKDPFSGDPLWPESHAGTSVPVLEEMGHRVAPLVSDKVIEAGRQARAVRNDPATAGKALSDAGAALRSSLSTSQDDPLTRIARGEV